MPKPIRLRIPEPCHENWEGMQQADGGRLTADQMNRTLTLAPPQHNGWGGWRWLLAGLLLTREDAGPRQAGTTITLKPENIQSDTTLLEVTSGVIVKGTGVYVLRMSAGEGKKTVNAQLIVAR